MDTVEAIRILPLFNEKADKLERYGFWQMLLNQSSGFRLEGGEGKNITITRVGPDDETIEATLLTFRQFMQKKDMVSIPKIAHLYDTLSLPPALVQRFTQTRESINHDLDSPSHVAEDVIQLTHRDIMDKFLFGDLSHMEEPKRRVYERWASNPILFPFLKNDFCATVWGVIDGILYLRELNKEAIAALAASAHIKVEDTET